MGIATLVSTQRKQCSTMNRNGRLAKFRVGTLSMIAILFLTSGVTRVLDYNHSPGTPHPSFLSAWAQTTQTQGTSETLPENDAAERLAVTLTKRERALTERERAIEERELLLELTQTEMEEVIAELEAAEASLLATIAFADQAAQADVDRLIKVYESMNPKEAALLFEAMDTSFSAGFLGEMNPSSAAEIMARLSPSVAYSISLILAGRNLETVGN